MFFLNKTITMYNNRYFLISISSSLFVSATNFAIKKMAVKLLPHSVDWVAFKFEIITNEGLILGWLSDFPLLVKTIQILFGALFVFMLNKSAQMYHQIPTIYIIAPWLLLTGLNGNFFEMILLNHVTDYISLNLPFIDSIFFNIDDILTETGAFLFTWQVIFGKKNIDKIYDKNLGD